MDDLTEFLKRSGISGKPSHADLSSRPSSHKVIGGFGSSSGEKGGFGFASRKNENVLGDMHMPTKPKSKAKRGGTDLTHLTTEADIGSDYRHFTTEADIDSDYRPMSASQWTKPASTSSSSFTFSMPEGKGFTYRGSGPPAAAVKAATDFVKRESPKAQDDDLSDL